MMIETYPITKVKQFAMTAAVLNSTLLLRSHQPYTKYIKIQINYNHEEYNSGFKCSFSFP